MPKVSPEYFDRKRDSILQAAYKVCKEKPLLLITMKDIIRESGVSQGGIYRYFKNLDELLAEVMNRNSPQTDYKKTIDDLLLDGGSNAKKVEGLLNTLIDYIFENADTLGKFHFELVEMVAYQPERVANISKKSRHIETTQYISDQLYSVIRAGAASGEFRPDRPVDDIMGFLSTSIDGIVIDSILHQCYGSPEREWGFDITRRIQTLAESVFMLLHKAV